MQFIKPDVQTICVGIAMTMGALLLAGGAKGKRMALPNAKILIHQVSGGFQGQATDIEIQAREMIGLKRRLEEIMSKHTGKDLEKVSKDMERDYFMTADGGQGVRHHRHRDRAPKTRQDSVARLDADTARIRGKRREVASASDGNEQLLCSFCGKSSGRSRS